MAKGDLIEDGKFHELYTGNYYATSKRWIAGIEGDEEIQLALYLEIVDMLEATGEDKFQDWPLLFEMEVMVAYPGPKWLEQAASCCGDPRLEATPERALEMSHSYGGGIPVTHILLHEISGGGSDIEKFSRKEVRWVTEKPTHGTVAAQRGPGRKFDYPTFREEDVALRFADELLKRADPLFGMVGVFLDRPINMVGDDGWKVIAEQSK